jgi:tetratricopeptide (TPR) repeat protein
MPRTSLTCRKAAYLFLSYLAATLLFVVNVHAQGRESAEVRLSRGMLLYEDKKYDEATRELLQAHQLDPRNTNVIYYLALSLSAQGKNAEAEAYVRKGLEVQPRNANLRLMLAYTLRAQGKTDQSRQIAESLQLEPASPLVGASRDLLTSLSTPRRGDTPFWFEATARGQYDSNVSLKPNTGSAVNGGRASSWGNLLALDTEYAFMRSPHWQSAVRYDMYQTINYNNHKFDYSDHVVGGRLTYTDVLPTTQRYFVTFRPYYDILLQQGREFLQRPTALFDSYLYWDPTGSNRTELLYQFQYEKFNEHPARGTSPFFPFNPNLGIGKERRDAFNHRVGPIHYMYFDRQRYAINFGYNYDREDAYGDNWKYSGHRAIAGFLITLPWDIRARESFEYHARFYDGGQNSIFGKIRKDQEYISLFSLSKDVTPQMTVSLEHLWDSNGSTIGDYRFRREVISLGLTWRYF